MSDKQKSDKICYFWRISEQNGWMSQWWPSPFCSENINFTCAEQYMMFKKALLFGDRDSAAMIRNTNDLFTMQAIGRAVKNFDEKKWRSHREQVVLEATRLKFTSSDFFKNLLLGTADSELVEASPKDRIWGIGYDRNSAEKHRHEWGLNLLGRALMQVREELNN